MNATYHVLGGTLSPLDGIGPDDLAIAAELFADLEQRQVVLGAE